MSETSTILAAVLLAVVPSLLYLVVLNANDRCEPEPWTILVTCIGVGAIVAPLATGAIFAATGRPATLPPAFAPGPRPDVLTAVIEELVLGLLVLGLIRVVRDDYFEQGLGAVPGIATYREGVAAAP